MIGTAKKQEEREQENEFQSPISGVNDWNKVKKAIYAQILGRSFSLLLAELMIGT